MNSTLATQVGQLAHRSVVRTLRQPAQIVPSLIFPLILLAVKSGGLKRVTNLPGFPTDSYLTFALAITFKYHSQARGRWHRSTRGREPRWFRQSRRDPGFHG